MDNPFTPLDQDNEQINVRLALAGPAGAGKSFTLLTLATTLCSRVAAVDTERGRLKEYKRRFRFDHFSPNRYEPQDLVRLIGRAGANGYDGLIIDGISPYWDGPGGALEFVDANTENGKSKFSGGWSAYRPIEQEMIGAILGYPGHVFVSMRVKTHYDVVISDGKAKPVKVGLKPIQRDNIEYEFSIVGEMDQAHTLTVSKTTCADLDGAVIARPGLELANTIGGWAGDGIKAPDALSLRDRALEKNITFPELRDLLEEARTRKLAGAAVMDDTAEITTLEKLIIARGFDLRGRQAPALATAVAEAAAA